MTENEISHEVIGAALDLNGNLGLGLLESAQCGLDVRYQVPIPLIYKSVKLDHVYRLDLLVEDKVIVELKSVECLALVHYARLRIYSRPSDKRLGLHINFK